MIGDALLLFSDAQAITATAASTSSIDLSVARDIGVGEELYLVVTVDTAFTDSGSDSTVTVDIEYDTSTTFTPDQTQRVGVFGALTAAGSKLIARIQPNQNATYPLGLRYAQLKYTVANGNLTTGAVTAQIVKNIDAYASYPKGYTIS